MGGARAREAVSYEIEMVQNDPLRGAGPWYRLALIHNSGRRMWATGMYLKRSDVEKYVATYHSDLPEVKRVPPRSTNP